MEFEDFLEIKKELSHKKRLDIKIVSDSMSPLIEQGKNYSIKAIDRKIKIFDIIIFYQYQRLNCHYVIRVKENEVITKALKTPRHTDFPTNIDHVLGFIEDKKLSFLQKAKILLSC